jgi:vancomycin permeability regulator SanA
LYNEKVTTKPFSFLARLANTWWIRLLFLVGVFLCALPFLLSIVVTKHYESQTYTDINNLPAQQTALVLGASVFKDGTPSDILSDRLLVARDLYKAGKVQKLLLTGSNQAEDYNETGAMEKFLLKEGVPASVLITDQSGHRTYDSCWRAKHVFGLNEAILITQSFHMPRALWLCNTLGLKSIGLLADHPRYQFHDWAYWKIRDILSLNKAFFDLYIRPPHVSSN